MMAHLPSFTPFFAYLPRNCPIHCTPPQKLMWAIQYEFTFTLQILKTKPQHETFEILKLLQLRQKKSNLIYISQRWYLFNIYFWKKRHPLYLGEDSSSMFQRRLKAVNFAQGRWATPVGMLSGGESLSFWSWGGLFGEVGWWYDVQLTTCNYVYIYFEKSCVCLIDLFIYKLIYIDIIQV